MARLALFSLLLAATTSCAPPRRSWQPVRSTETSSYAVIWQGAPMHVAPDRSAPSLTLLSARAAREPWGRTALAPFRVLWERDGWVALETLGAPSDPHCATSPPALASMRLKLFVPSAALVPVTTREVDQSFQDGTSIHLGRGVPLEPLGNQNLFRARFGSLTTVVRLAPGEVGTRYLPSTPAPPLGRAMMLSGEALEAGVPTIAESGRVHSDHANAMPAEVIDMQGGSESRVEIRPRCGRLVVRVPFHAVGPPAGLLFGALGRDTTGDTFLEAGTPLFWGDGREAGRTSERLFLRREIAGAEGRRCFTHALRFVPPEAAAPDPSAFITLCVAARDVIDPSVPLARRLDDPAGAESR